MKVHVEIRCTSYPGRYLLPYSNRNLFPNGLRFGSRCVVTAHTRVLHNNPHHQRFRRFCSACASCQSSMGNMRAASNRARADKAYEGASSRACSREEALQTELGMSHRTRAPCFPIKRSVVRGNQGPSATLEGQLCTDLLVHQWFASKTERPFMCHGKPMQESSVRVSLSRPDWCPSALLGSCAICVCPTEYRYSWSGKRCPYARCRTGARQRRWEAVLVASVRQSTNTRGQGNGFWMKTAMSGPSG